MPGALVAGRAPEHGGTAAGQRGGVRVLRALGALGLLGVLASVFLVAAGSATRPSLYVPARRGGWPHWLAGPLQGLHVGISSQGFQALTLIMCASYLAVLIAARTLPRGAIVGVIVASYAILLLGPPLISQDVFGYLGFARLGALHGLDPYTHVTAEAPTDPILPFVGWPFQHSPYGPLFTLASYASVPLGLAAGLWSFKAIAVLASLGAVALTGRAARGAGRSPRWAMAFVGLNPVLLELALGGAHNDTLVMLLLAGALAITAVSAGGRTRLSPRPGVPAEHAPDPPVASSSRLRAAAVTLVAGVGIKLSAGLVLPFLVLAPPRARERAGVALTGVLSLAVLAAIGLIGFGAHALGFLGAVGEQQQLVAVHSIPAETARLVGLTGTPTWWRHLFLALFAAVFAFALWRTATGTDWRVAAGWTMLALLLSTAWLLPWYAIWALPLAAIGGDRRLRGAVLLFCAYAMLIHLPVANPVLSP
jgi:alpha-1,6-mannosyltransferase